MKVDGATRKVPNWTGWLGGLLGIAALTWVLRSFDLDRFFSILEEVEIGYLALVPLFMLLEQLVRAWKWRQLLIPLQAIRTLHLFGAIMAGYLLAILIPFGFGTVARSWLVARRENLKLPSVLATVAIDRLTDGIVFVSLVPVALLSVAFSDPTGGIRNGLGWGAFGSFLLFTVVIAALVGSRRGAPSGDGWSSGLIKRLPQRVQDPAFRLNAAFAAGVAWPHEAWRGTGVVVASLLIKLLAATNFLWAGLAVGVVLAPAQYLFLLVFLGFLVILGHFARVAGSFVIGGIFALGLMGVEEERALVMALIVEASYLLSTAAAGTLSLWWQGVKLGEVRRAASHAGAQAA